jgi:hypothetical protein
MRFMILRKSDNNMETGTLPSKQLLAAVGRYNDDLRRAGVLLGGEWLLPSATGARINVSGNKVTTTDGPFAEVKELIAGFILIEVNSKEEAIAWARRCPTMDGHCEAEMEVRQVFEASDFPPELTYELTRHASASVAKDAERLLHAQAAAKS